jgi:hypothetical protein
MNVGCDGLVREVRNLFIWFHGSRVCGGAAREYCGGLSYDEHVTLCARACVYAAITSHLKTNSEVLKYAQTSRHEGR